MLEKQEIGKTLMYYLIDNDMTAKELAEKMDVSKASVYRWMSGKPMTNRYYIKLLKILDGYNPSNWIIEKSDTELKDYMFND